MRTMVALVLLLSLVDTVANAFGAEPQEADLVVFTREGCPYCDAAAQFLARLQRERPGLRLIVKDVGKDRSAGRQLEELAAQKGVTALGVPAFYLRGELLVGYGGPDSTGAQIIGLLDWPRPRTEPVPLGACAPKGPETCGAPAVTPTLEADSVQTAWFGRLNARDMGLPAFTLALGLLDGFNPCAMWVLVFLLSLLVNLRDRWKMFIIAGTFVAVSGLVYFAFMAAWLNVFVLVGLSRASEVVLGGIAVMIGAINVKDFWAFRRGMTLGIPEAAKPGLYAGIRKVLSAERLPEALAAVALLACLVNVIELLCTAGFPAIYTRVLTLRQLPWWEYYGYLALYNVAYVLDDSLMVAIAVFTLSRSKLQEKAGRWLKLASGLVMLGLGAVLVVAPHRLA
ncbi:MAG: NrdH-redoxin [Nitrospirae bacterium]|nr:MAG: NrdH-redoxin [Nitrospirota bacterium]